MLHFPNVVLAERRLGKRADELIEIMGLGDFRDKFVSDLSTGSRRIVDLACQIGIEPKVILLDEPSSGIAQRETEALGPLLLRIREHHGREHPAHRARHAARQRPSPTASSPATSGGSWSTATGRLVRNHPHVVASYLGSTREVIERSGPSTGFEYHRSGRGGTSMTQTETEAPQFKAADERSPTRTSVGSGASSASTRTRSASRGRRCSGRSCAARSRRLKWLFIVMIIYTSGLLQVTNLTRGMVDNGDRRTRSRRCGTTSATSRSGRSGRSSSRWPQQQIADRLAYQIEFDMRVWLYTHIQSADLRRLDQVATGQLVTRSLTDIQLVDTLLDVSRSSSATRRSCSSVAIIVTIINPIMGVLSILALPINVWLVNKFREPAAGVELGRAQRARRGHHRHRRARARASASSRRSAARTRSRKGRRRHRARVPLRDDPHPAASPATTSICG